MNKEQFIYWLQGFFGIADTKYGLDARQTQVIKDHLELVFEKVTLDDYVIDDSAAHIKKYYDGGDEIRKSPGKSSFDLPDPWSWVGDRTQFDSGHKHYPVDHSPEPRKYNSGYNIGSSQGSLSGFRY